jgi:alanine racemase
MGTIFQFPYRTVAEVNLRSLVKNLYTLRSESGKEILPVVKADAYGHGIVNVARALVNRGSCRMLLVATLEEAILVREHLPYVQILVLSGFFPHQLDAYTKFNVIPLIHSLSHLKSLLGRRDLPDIHLKIDSGMHRLGIPLDQMDEALKIVGKLPIKLSGIASHFAEPEDLRSKFTDLQVARFEEVLDECINRRLLQTDARIHIGNTAAALRGKLSRTNAIRPGIGLYGISPNQNLPHSKDLIPILDWKTRILCLKHVAATESVGYGRTYSPKKRERLAVLPIGYADGYPRLLSNRGHVLINGRRCPVRGRVSMDLISVDVTQVPAVREGQAVTLLGSHGKHSLTAWELARWAETIPYEIWCGISSRVPRIYLD